MFPRYINEESRQYVTINTHLRLIRDTRLSFAVEAIPAIFQQTMDPTLSGLNWVNGGILEDLIVTGPNDNMENTLERLNSMGVKLKQPKCVIMKSSVEYFAFVVVQTIQEVQEPQNASGLESFLGLVNYYRKFIPDMSSLVHPLNRLLMIDAPSAWTKAWQKAFKNCLKNCSLTRLCWPPMTRINQFCWLSTSRHMVWEQSCHLSRMTEKKSRSRKHPPVSQQVSKDIS